MIRSALTGLAFATVLGCGDPPPPADTYTVRGVYLGAAYDSAAAVVDHEAIPGVMDAMQMPIRVSDAALLRELRSGDKIAFLLADTGDGYEMQTVETLAPDTPLDLARTEADTNDTNDDDDRVPGGS